MLKVNNRSLIVSLLFLCVFMQHAVAESLPAHLAKWAEENPVVHVGIDGTFPPFDYVDEKGVTQGAGKLIRQQLSMKLPIDIKEASISDFRREFDSLTRGDIDAISVCGNINNRQGKVLFTRPFLQMTPIVVVNKNSDITSEMDLLPSKSIASIEGYADAIYAKKLSANYIGLQTNLEGYESIESGKYDAFVTYLYLYKYMIKSHKFKNIKPIAISQFESLPIGFCVNKDKPMLVEVLNWGIEHLGDDFSLVMQSKWAETAINGSGDTKTEIDKGISLQQVSIFSSLCFLFVLFFARKFASVIAIKLDTRIFRVTYFSVLVLIISLSAMSIYLFLNQYEKKIIAEQKETFNITRDVTKKALAGWYTERESLAENIAKSDDFIGMVNELVVAKESGNNSQFVEAQQVLRTYFSKRPYTTQGNKAYTISDLQGRYLLNLVQSAEGEISPVFTQRPELFNNVLRGNTQFIPPVWSNVEIDNNTHPDDKDAEVFIATPVRNPDDEVIAVLGFRFDPDREFSQLFIDGRLGETFESYAVDTNGYMISSSRFTDDLQQKGLVPINESSVLHIRLNSPETNRIVQAAKFKLSGQDLDGYINYRGKSVVGQWITLKGFNFTIVSEIQLNEMLSEYYAVRSILRIGLIIAIALILSISIFMMTISNRANDMSRRSQKELTAEVNLRTKELKESEQKNKLINSSVADGILGVDKQGRFIFANESASIITGYSEETFLSNDLISLFAGNNDENISFEDTVIYEAIQSKKVIRIENESVLISGARELPIEYSISPVEDENSDLACVIAMKDITLRVQETERLEKMLEHLPVCMVIMNQNDEVEQINQTGVELLGYTREEIVGKPVNLFIPSEQIDSHKALLNKLFSEEVVVDTRYIDRDFKITHESGKLIEVQAVYTPVHFYNGLYAAVMVRDITLDKQAEIALIEAKRMSDDASKAKSDFLANMSHEIRTPMNAIMGMSHLALECELARKPHNYVTKVYKASESLLGIINDILDFSKIEAGKLDIEYIEFNLHDTFADLANIIAFKAAEKNLELLFDISSDVPTILKGDSLRLNQILINLASNAVKFTEQGQVVISVSLAKNVVDHSDDDITLEFSVKDSGIGMDLQQQKKLFKSFSQADSSITRKYGGTGLGLTISKNLVELMQGKIWLTSKLGEGSNFNFTTKLQRSDTSNNTLADKQNSFLAAKRILIVDDNVIALGVLRSILESFHCDVITAENGQDAIELINKHTVNFDFIILDWKMPGLDGIETYRQIKSQNDYQDNQFILITAHEDDSQVLKELENPIDSVIVKPVTSSSLFDEMMRLNSDEAFTHTRYTKRDDEFIRNKESLSGAKILLVEDNDLNQELAMELLRQADIEVELAENGAIAVKKFTNQHFDGILMDLQMPIMDGFSATKIIRAQDTTIPIIAMTANAMVSDKEKVLSVGMNDHISKPINVNAMFATIAKWISPSALGGAKLTSQKTHVDVNTEALSAEENLNIPHFKSIDINAGIAVANGDKSLYIKLLNKFVKGQSDFVKRFNSALINENQEQATLIVHTLKGSAGNIGAKALQASSKTLEQLSVSRFDRDVLSPLVNNVSTDLHKVLDELTNYFEESAKKENEPKVNDRFVFTAAIIEELNTLLRLLEGFETESIELAETILTELKGSKYDSSFNEIYKVIENYQFAEAEKSLQAFINLTINQ